MNEGLPTRQLTAFIFGAFLLAAAILVGCGNDESGGGETPAIEEGIQELQGFAEGAQTSTAGQVLAQPQITALLNELGLSLNGNSPLIATRLEEIEKKEADLPRRDAIKPRTLLRGTIFGTYERAPADTTHPFLGWVMAKPGVPPDGFIFRFQEDDDIVIPEGDSVRHLAGEIRFLEIDVDDNGTPFDFTDDVLLHVHFEISILGESPDPLVRLDYHATLDPDRQPETIDIGDETNLSSSYFGDISIAVNLNTAGNDASGLIQLVNRALTPDYVVRLTFTATDLDTAGVPQSASFTFGYGRSNTPTAPPWLVAATLDSFVVDTNLDVTANVEGTITFRSRPVAIFGGNTRQVPVNVDTDGDGDVDADDTCIDVNLTRVGSTESQNICEALGPLVRSLPFGHGGAFLPLLK